MTILTVEVPDDIAEKYKNKKRVSFFSLYKEYENSNIKKSKKDFSFFKENKISLTEDPLVIQKNTRNEW